MLSSAPTTGWYKYTYIPSTFSLPPHPPHLTPLGHHRASSWAPRAIQHLATSHLFYTCMCIQLLSHVWPDFMDCSLPSSTVHGIFQATVLQWVAISFSRGSSWAGYWTCISCVCCTGRWVLCHCECVYVSPTLKRTVYYRAPVWVPWVTGNSHQLSIYIC